MAVSTAPPSRLEARRRFGDHAGALIEMLVGCLLLGVATLAGLAFVHRPWPNRVDAIGFRLLPADLSSRWAVDVAHLGSLIVLIVGAAVLCGLAAMSRNWMRALSCLIAPITAVLIVQTVAKPLVGRHFEGSTSLSYPSGTVTAVAALAAAAFLVAPLFAKPLVAVAVGVVVVAVCAAVVVLRWHYPTDALGGVCVGTGAVFAVDGLLLSIYNPQPVRLRS
jgi:membrane-associated phospholipid phosphatase